MPLLELLANGSRGTAIAAPARAGIGHPELRAQAEAVGRQLRGVGVGANDRVAIVLPGGPAMASVFVCMAPWCATAPLNPAYTANEFEFHLKDLRARALVVEDGASAAADASATADVGAAVAVAEAANIPVLRVAEGDLAGSFRLRGAPESVVRERPPESVALILHTSGTTSRPKMVPLSQANLAASARNIAATLRLTPADRCLNVMPLFHIHGLMAPVLASLAAGGAVVCAPGFDALRFFAWLRAERPTWYSAVPTMHQAILARAKRNAQIAHESKLRFIRSSSASLPPQVMGELESVFGAPVIEAYAMTEAAHQMCSNPLPPAPRKAGFVGPAAGPEVAIMNAEGALLGVGEEGEVVIRGENVTSGYLGNEQANAAAFHGGWFRTGDQGVMDADRYLKITGRLKEVINRGGEKVAPLEVDEALLDHPSVEQVCTFALPHAKLGEEVAAAVVLRDGATATERELRRFVRARLADFKVPRRVVFVPEIPKGPTGKVQRIGLAARLGLLS